MNGKKLIDMVKDTVEGVVINELGATMDQELTEDEFGQVTASIQGTLDEIESSDYGVEDVEPAEG